MKNKKATYILLPVVLIIWGIVIYKIFSSVGSKEVIQAENFSYSSLLPVKITLDTFSIVVNYRDPFLGKTIIASSHENYKSKVPSNKVEKLKPESIPWPTISYRGMIKNQKTNKQFYLLTINNQDNMMKPGDVVLNVELKKVYRDSIEAVFRKESKVIKK